MRWSVIRALTIVILAALPAIAWAQSGPNAYANATVVSSCGTPIVTPVAGHISPITMDTTGTLCTAGGGGGGASNITQWLNTSVAAPTGNNADDVSPLAGGFPGFNNYNYTWNPTEGAWDRAQAYAGASPYNVTLTDCSIALTTGTTAQAIIPATTVLHGFTIQNIDTSAGSGEPVWFSLTTTAAASTVGSYVLPAPTATTFVGATTYTVPPGAGTNHAVSVIAATTGHKISCTYW